MEKVRLIMGDKMRGDLVYTIFYKNRDTPFTIMGVAEEIGATKSRTALTAIIRKLYNAGLIYGVKKITQGGGRVYRVSPSETNRRIYELINILLKK